MSVNNLVSLQTSPFGQLRYSIIGSSPFGINELDGSISLQQNLPSSVNTDGLVVREH